MEEKLGLSEYEQIMVVYHPPQKSSSENTTSYEKTTSSSEDDSMKSASSQEDSVKSSSLPENAVLSEDDEEEMSDSDFPDGLRYMTRKERLEHFKQIDDSHGFEVKSLPPGVTGFGVFAPCDLSLMNEDTEYAFICVKGAIYYFNQTPHKIDEGELEFHKLEMAVMTVVCGSMYFLTFTAKNAKEGRIITYQSKVVFGGDPELQVLSFRRKPTDPAGAKKTDYFWSDIRCVDPCDCSNCSGCK